MELYPLATKTDYAKELWIRVKEGEAFDRDYLKYLENYFKEDAINNTSILLKKLKLLNLYFSS